MHRTGATHFNVQVEETAARYRRFLDTGAYEVYLAFEGADPIGFVTLCESHALYAEGTFGIIQELYVRAPFRLMGTGDALVEAAKRHAKKKGGRAWSCARLRFPSLSRSSRSTNAMAFP